MKSEATAAFVASMLAIACGSSGGDDGDRDASRNGDDAWTEAGDAASEEPAPGTELACDQEPGSAWSYVPANVPGGLSSGVVAGSPRPELLVSTSGDALSPFFAISQDGGETWCRHRRKGALAVYGIARSAADPRVLYGAFYDRGQRSRDGGQTWEEIARTPLVPTFWLSERNPLALIACSTDRGALLTELQCSLSVDGGSTFVELRKPASIAKVRVVAAAIDPAIDGRAYLLTTQVASSRPGVAEKATVTLLVGPPDQLAQIALPTLLSGYPQLHVFPGGELVILHGGGVIASRDGGTTWATESTNTSWAASAHDAERIWAVGPEGTFQSTDRARSWIRIGDAPEDVGAVNQQQTPQLLLAGSPATTAYLTTRSRIHRFSGSPPSWSLTYFDTAENVGAVTGRDHPSLWSRVVPPMEGWYRSDDEGKRWAPLPAELRRAALGLHARDRSHVVMAPDLPLHSLEGLRFSDDGGRTFDGPKPCSVMVDRTLPPASDAQFRRSSGLSSLSSFTFVRVGAPESREFYAMIGPVLLRSNVTGEVCTPLVAVENPFGFSWWVAPSDPDRMYAMVKAPDETIHRVVTRDGWRSWTPIDPGVIVNSTFTVDPSSADTVYACDGQLCRKSNDSGTTWTTIIDFGPERLKTHVEPLSIAVDPTRPNVLYLSGDAVQRSRDGGLTWEPLPGDPAPFVARSIAVDDFEGGYVWVWSFSGLMRHLND